jgi:hypothetical protein
MANTLTKKFIALKSQFFPSLLNTNILDINLFSYLELIKFNLLIMKKDITILLWWVLNDKAPSLDEIPNQILKIALN